MRTTTRLCLVLAVVATAGLVAVPTVSAKSKANRAGAWVSQLSDLEKNQNKGIRQARRRAQRAHERIENLKDFAFGLAANNNKQQTDIDAVSSTVATIVAGVPTIVSGLTALQNGLVTIQGVLQNTVSPALTTLGNGLTAVNAALQDSTTGLVGLNNARPQFGVLAPDATFLGGTGAAGGQGPAGDDDTFQGGTAGLDVDGLYVVDFNNNVSTRMYAVNVFPLGATGVPGGGGASNTASAANCSVAGIDALCGIVQNGAAAPADADPNKVLVQYGDGSSGGPPNGFSVTAISG